MKDSKSQLSNSFATRKRGSMAFCLLMTSRISRAFLKKAYSVETNSDRALPSQQSIESTKTRRTQPTTARHSP